MPSIKLKRVKPGKRETKPVLIRKKPKSTDNVIKARKPIKLRPKKTAEDTDTSIIDQQAKPYSAEIEEGDNRTFRGYAVTAIGPVLDTTGVTATRWVKSGLLPKPIFRSGRADVYHVEEVRSFYRILSEHQKDHKQYKAEHADVRRRLFDENSRIRDGLFAT